MLRIFCCWLALLLVTMPLAAKEVRLAVASNFLTPVKALAKTFEQETGHRLIISSGSTGKLYAQIRNGAPYDLFLAANRREPERLEREAKIHPGSRFTYARGVLALWIPEISGTDRDARASFAAVSDQRVAIANPRTAPYGAAAQVVLKAWSEASPAQGRLLRGENISQAYQFVATGNAAAGFVALSQMKDPARPPSGHYWAIDEHLHPPIDQQVVLLARAGDNPAAQAFWEYLKSPAVRERIQTFGYGLE